MKNILVLLGAGLISLMAGCATAPVALGPVGPDPTGTQRADSEGWLQVFSKMDEQRDDQNQGALDEPIWYQHTAYEIYALDAAGEKPVKHVANTVGHYVGAPERVALPAGRYLVEARAKDYSLVTVPVTIEHGRTTRVHLDDNWKVPAAPKGELVSLPNGNPVGWRAESWKEFWIK